MKAMILAAGKGERMRPLTERCPKPMLEVAGKPMLEHHIEQLKKAGVTDIVINHAWYGEKIVEYFADGAKWGVSIHYSEEEIGALETAGGIIKALPMLGKDPFILVNGDVFCLLDYQKLPALGDKLAHLCLVDNPLHNKAGDFTLKQTNVGVPQGKDDQTYTYAGIAVLSPLLFKEFKAEKGPLPLGPILKSASRLDQVSGEVIVQDWTDVGTPERLTLLNQQIEQSIEK
ncbi:nucleotidyltransferase [Thalassotalea loyana]|uniref:Nucleotidyltransferase n=1 Tax=Thalassotalea loyana TaxID=280483 RepID=A0ABQ6HB81_9GAMM|nr:nucleotidyltransferase family protein [Thalassotalea loyana]GLX84025.1 nucleotidyltransferase [Thalassotalea loyana]